MQKNKYKRRKRKRDRKRTIRKNECVCFDKNYVELTFDGKLCIICIYKAF